MKNLEISIYGVEELSQKEIVNVEGGSWFGRAIRNVGNALESAWDWCIDHDGATYHAYADQ